MPATSDNSISIVIPAYNSRALIDDTVALLATRLGGMPAELIIVENGSTDGTFAHCRELADAWPVGASPRIRVLQSPKGMGSALRAGIAASEGAWVLLTADDLPFGVDDLDAVDAVRRRTGRLPRVAIGSKLHPDSRVERGVIRDLSTLGFAILRRVVLGMRTRDPQGTIWLEGTLARRIGGVIEEPGFLFTTELVYAVERLGIRPVEVPVRLRPRHSAHQSRVSARDALSMAAGLLRVRRRHRRSGIQELTSGRQSRGQ